MPRNAKRIRPNRKSMEIRDKKIRMGRPAWVGKPAEVGGRSESATTTPRIKTAVSQGN
ncbi:MAG: hypothetical protein WA148_05375 [Actinomycetota bacterium]